MKPRSRRPVEHTPAGHTPLRDSKLSIGWREWAAFPELGIPAIKFKTDTGARTTALHAENIQAVERDGLACVSFLVHPLQRTRRYGIECIAPVVEKRVIKDSGAHRQKRYVIETPILIGGLYYPVEVTLTDRSDMRFRMLLGRTAMSRYLQVRPGSSYLLGRMDIRQVYVDGISREVAGSPSDTSA